MAEFHSGGCQCGAVRFRVEGAPRGASICHCRMCQKAVGNYFAAYVGFKAEQVEWTRGGPTIFVSSDFAKRGFCSACGTPLTYQYSPKRISLAIGAFDEPNLFPPTIQYEAESKVAHFDSAIQTEFAPLTEDPEEIEYLSNIKNLQHPDHDTSNWPPEE